MSQLFLLGCLLYRGLYLSYSFIRWMTCLILSGLATLVHEWITFNCGSAWIAVYTVYTRMALDTKSQGTTSKTVLLLPWMK